MQLNRIPDERSWIGGGSPIADRRGWLRRLARGMALALLISLVFAWLSPALALAQGFGQAEPVIVEGREADVLALLPPHVLGGEVVPGWKLMNVQIEATRVRLVVVGPRGEEGSLILEHPRRAPKDAGGDVVQSKSFALLREPRAPPSASPALDALTKAVIANDPGAFWADEALVLPDGRGHFGRSGLQKVLDRVVRWSMDGIILGAVGLVLLVALCAHRLRAAPRWVGLALAGTVLFGLVARLALSPRAALGVWPYSRLYSAARLIYEGPTLALLSERLDARVPLTDVVFATTLALAVVTPLAMFAHASYVLRDPRHAVASAALIAMLPSHVRFSHSDSEFILSIVLGALSFALLHAFFAERTARIRWVAGALLGPVLYAAVCARELNILLVPLLLAALYLFHVSRASRGKLALASALVVGVGALAFLSELVARYSRQMNEGALYRYGHERPPRARQPRP